MTGSHKFAQIACDLLVCFHRPPSNDQPNDGKKDAGNRRYQGNQDENAIVGLKDDGRYLGQARGDLTIFRRAKNLKLLGVSAFYARVRMPI